MRFVLKNGAALSFNHRGTVVDSNAVLTSNHWLGSYDLNNVESWEILGGAAHDTLLISGKPEDFKSSGPDKLGGLFDLIVFNPAVGNLQNKADLGDATLLQVGDILQQAVIRGAREIGQAPGLFEVAVSSTDYRSIRVIRDITTVSDSGLGLFDEKGVVYGVNWGSSAAYEGLYGAVTDPGKVKSEISRLKREFTP